MSEQTSKLRFFIAITIGGIGAFGQSYLLHHELVDCLPYKIMDADFYRMIAKFGICFAPTIAIILGILFGLKRPWLTIITPVVLCPLLFAFIFKMISILRSELSGFDQATWHFDGKIRLLSRKSSFSIHWD